MYVGEVKWNLEKLNEDIKLFDKVTPITKDMENSREGISRMVMLDRYAYKDTDKKTLGVGDLVVCTVKEDPNYPQRGVGIVQSVDGLDVKILLEEDYRTSLTDDKEIETGVIERSIASLDKPLEVYYEQISDRVSRGLSEVEENSKKQAEIHKDFAYELKNEHIVPAGRVLYGAGSGEEVTYFNCFVLPFPQDSREGLGFHRQTAMDIMSRGGGVGTNGSTLRPKDTLARGVNGKSSGSVSWLDDLSQLTNLIQQGGSRRGAQMIMLADSHPDILEFVISKMQNPDILRFIIEKSDDYQIKSLAEDKLKFTPLTSDEREVLEEVIKTNGVSDSATRKAEALLNDGGRYSVHHPDFLSGANISIAITNDFMDAVEADSDWELKFPDTDNYSKEDMEDYDNLWHDVGDVREWEDMGYAVKTHRTIPAQELWKLINICATYSAEPKI